MVEGSAFGTSSAETTTLQESYGATHHGGFVLGEQVRA